MQFTIATIIALAATGAVAQNGQRQRGGGATRGGQGNTAAVQTCRVSASVIPAGEAQAETGGSIPSNLDGSRISAQACAAVGGQNFGGCCVKNDCAGAGSRSACLVPNLSGDQRFPGSFVNGACPQGLRCFLRSN
ncbi:Hypothetical protein D9617_2g055950 [Elsinoe fawcettii]|nr:Hypothetical protein D9617_2g055950 [Elsinoe fawcettii]